MWIYTWASTCKKNVYLSFACSLSHTLMPTVTHTVHLIFGPDISLPRGIPNHQVLSHSPVSPAFLPRAINDQVESENLAKMAAYLEWRCHITLTTRSSPQNIISVSQQSQGSQFISPHDLSVWLICCNGNRILGLHGSDSNQTQKSFSVLNDWLDDSWHEMQHTVL